MKTIEFRINQELHVISEGSAELDWNLLELLRRRGYTGAKKVCGEGGCGACTVIVSRWHDAEQRVQHHTVTACLVPVPALHRCQITTIEGLAKLSPDGDHPICEAFWQLGASQCGFCSPGFVLALACELDNRPLLRKDELERLFDGNLCRCTGYRPILDAASVFCQDPLPDHMYGQNVHGWRERLGRCRSLSEVFPAAYCSATTGYAIAGASSRWISARDAAELEAARDHGGEFVGGNTDLGVRDQAGSPPPAVRLSVLGVGPLHRLEFTDEHLNIGAAVSIDRLADALAVYTAEHGDDTPSCVRALADQCRFFGNNQVRSVATVGGGLMSFSTYSDLVPVWVAVGAEASFLQHGQTKRVVLAEAYDAHGRLGFEPSRAGLLTELRVPLSRSTELVASYKYARRRLDAIAFLSAAIGTEVAAADAVVLRVVLCFDGLGPTGFRALQTEAMLRGRVLDGDALVEALASLEVELRRAISNRFPARLQNHQVRLALGAFVRFYWAHRAKFHGAHESAHADLLTRYPTVGHRTHLEMTESRGGVLGRAIPHLDARQQTTGKAQYTADREVPNCLYAALVRSPIASGRIDRIDASAALQMPDVVGFVAARDIPGSNRFGFRVEDEEVLASAEVGYVGQAVGVVVARSERAAQAAARRVELELSPAPPLLSFEAALAAKSFHGNPSGYQVRQGDLQRGFDASAVIIEGELRTPPQSHFYLEPQSCLVVPHDDGYEVYSSTQSPSNVADHISRVLGVAKNKVEVSVGRLGGGFGGKQLRAGPIAAICALAAHHAARPVKLTLSREEDLAYCPGRSPIWAKYKAGFAADGRLTAVDITFYLSGGWTNDYSADITETATLLMDGCYFVPNVSVVGYCLRTNYGSHTATRGFGKPQASAIIETIVDRGAVQLSLDPTIVRERNLYRRGDHTITKTKIDDDVVRQCWARVIDKSNYPVLRQQIDEFNRGNRWLKRGLAVVSSKGNMGFLESDDINRGIAVVQIQRDATVSLSHSGCEMGQGINTRMAQVTAHHLGIALDDVDVSDTRSAAIPDTPPTTMVATDLIGRAIIEACAELRERLGAFPGSFREQVEQAYDRGVALHATGRYTAPRLQYDYDKQQGDISYFFVWGSALSVVEVDVVSGNFRIVKSVVVQDCGESLNPHLDIGQAEGGFMFGVGLYTMEELIYADDGRLITDNVSGYKIPSCGDVPLDWDVELLSYTPAGEGLHNSKGIGEANTQLGLSVYFAIKDAVRAARADAALPPDFAMDFPASVDRVSEHLPSIDTLARALVVKRDARLG